MIRGTEEQNYARGNQVNTAKALQKAPSSSPAQKKQNTMVVKDSSGRSIKLNDGISGATGVRRRGSPFSKHMKF